ncbi:MAG: fumarate hydratase [Candidatus Edwardsbacteria bacterium RIFOXYD12_FULL_50_11]|uniref:Fumarate hydratase n=1 Tax=Candidatus Edwardsbacteria bacterium GWF2_54_11 TaxID=1817851 RepID=A0A1F5R4J2_9BACT|nr:MAG: fumarate hydratase [Candidatus Edwardsbacteria bacterium RifOxyC12_full_54_24]OGF07315.1 MAG: fumarate hydratase [Candidatus Edwardsbacteria bacterium RifOxyA12_full_54_48]OGF09309.1 MAG: fumarate hydratase [Candidatus Edwardsbacteria bacterium GWF2_54_11]OGF09567.1 MAG: fumarate hydratase [Candidatus Edwardsbacteria bacterium GWE2_54_12]OGF17167.1 MAG: fumarate hydratase [Candidatus Edwardsbacteria bacterium RIFOXYD12_FULL_50_11]OGJ19746.1 MAG: fumarate hydratase [Candidatus Edwardsba
MRTIEYKKIVETVKEMCLEANYDLPQDVIDGFKKAVAQEESPLGKSILEQCLKNAQIAKDERVPICQDTGLSVFFINIGADVKIDGGLLKDAVNEGVRQGYKDGYLRKSSLDDPLFARKNTGDNTPAIIHLDIVDGDKLDITMAPKGGGAENMSRLAMLPPSAGEKGVIDFVVDTIVKAGGNPCPPTVVGVGIGGTFEKVAYLAKKALMWPLNALNQDERYDQLEKRILHRINNSGVGPQGLGGNVTSFAIHIEHHPCHLASLPVAVNVNCHAHRHAHRVL